MERGSRRDRNVTKEGDEELLIPEKNIPEHSPQEALLVYAQTSKIRTPGYLSQLPADPNPSPEKSHPVPGWLPL